MSLKIVKSERGNVLFVTLLIIVIVTALGALALNSAITSTRSAGFMSLQKQSNAVAEAAVLSGIEYLDWNLDAVVAYTMEHGQYEYHHDDLLTATDTTPPVLFSDDAFGRPRLEPYFSVIFDDIAPARRAAEFDEGFCYMRLNMHGVAGIIDENRLD
ncbi:MAG: pilus assembly PilX N-terminal domain-containing protein, partial [Candidatus Marinimicrobia bacterium]|nr:pilus assembly PilX N-terminal domain-containing protein [Candidatus Neomarinimicrobiota bacterium]